jgi:hypothetical protein
MAAPLIDSPIGLLLDAEGNLVRVGGRLQLARGLDAVVQGVRFRLRLCMGEWFKNRTAGVPYLENDLVPANQALLGQRYDENKLRAALRKPILATPGVREIVVLTTTFDAATREASATWSARTIFGDTPVNTLAVP